jgi:hypothetical protein
MEVQKCKATKFSVVLNGNGTAIQKLPVTFRCASRIGHLGLRAFGGSCAFLQCNYLLDLAWHCGGCAAMESGHGGVCWGRCRKANSVSSLA